MSRESTGDFQQQFDRELDRRGARLSPSQLRPAEAVQRRVGPTLLYPQLSHDIVGAAIEVHRHIGPGQLESVYQSTMVHELGLRGIRYQTQVPVELSYKGLFVTTFRLDLVVDNLIIVELKAVDRPHPVHRAQLVSYLRATGLRLGLLVNFNVELVHRSVMRVVL